MTGESVLANARIVLLDEVVTGTVRVVDGRIAAVDSGATALAGALDCDGDYLIPGLIEMHTDNMEKHLVPRPKLFWPAPISSVLAHDTQIAGAGITTVYDAIAVGEFAAASQRRRILDEAVEAIAEAARHGLLKADHRLHLRCEIADPAVVDMFAPHVDNPLVQLVSVMDHTPGQRQFRDIEKMRRLHRNEAWSEQQLNAYLEERVTLQAQFADRHRSAILDMCRHRGLPLASHDDTTPAHIDEAVADGITIAEFPTTREAAAQARRRGLAVVMGAPNVVQGGSHSGNVSALDLAREGLLDVLSSDCVPASLLHAAFMCAGALAIALPASIRMVTANVAGMLSLDDRGEIVAGKRADLVRVRVVGELPVVRCVWRQGARIA